MIHCFGDSNSIGLKPGTWEFLEPKLTWPHILSDILGDGLLLTARGGRMIYRDNSDARVTFGGEPIPSADSVFPKFLEHIQRGDWALIALGKNDVIFSQNYREDLNNVHSLVACWVTEILKKTVNIVLIGPSLGPNRSDGELHGASTIRKDYATIAELNGIRYTDCAAPSSIDSVHLDEAGHINMANRIIEVMRNAHRPTK